MRDPVPTISGLRKAGRELAASLRIVAEDPAPAPQPHVAPGALPEDYVALMSVTGPGTLAHVLRLLVPGCDDQDFNSDVQQQLHTPPHPDARLWGVFSSGETCWWLPLDDDPTRWWVALDGHGRQQLNLTATEFLDEWLDGRLDLPILSMPPVSRERTLTRAGSLVASPAAEHTHVGRDPLAQLQTIIGPGSPTPGSYDWETVERELGIPGLPTDYKRLYEAYDADYWIVLNGIFVEHPSKLASRHAVQAEILQKWNRRAPHPEPGGLLYCGSTEGRATLWWDTRGPDPAQWPAGVTDDGEHEPFGTITELLVAELTGVGPGLTDSSLGDPREWAWPMWGPRLPRKYPRRRSVRKAI